MGVLGTIRGAIEACHHKIHIAVRGEGRTTDTPTIVEEIQIASQPSSLPARTSHFLSRKGKAANLRVVAKYRADAQSNNLERSVARVEKVPIRESPFIESYMVIRNLGGGGNGEVDLCRDSRMGTLVAVKTVCHNDQAPPNEVFILQMLGRHDNIVQYHTMLSQPTINGDTQLIFEYCPRGDLVDYLNDLPEDTFAETFIWHFFKHVASGLHHMHRQGIIHGDIKGTNILLTTPRQGERYPLPKIADFGTGSVLPSRNVPRGHFGTRGFQPPEWETRYGSEADIWALGSIIHEIAHGSAPIRIVAQPKSEAALWFHMNNKRIPPNTSCELQYQEMCYYTAFHIPCPRRIDRSCRKGAIVYSKLLNYFMMRTLDFDPDSRISAMELCQILPTLEVLVHNILLSDQEHLLDHFDDGHDDEWKLIRNVRDSGVLRAIFCALATRSSDAWHSEALEWGTHLLHLIDPLD